MQSKPLMHQGWLVCVSFVVHMSSFNKPLFDTCH